MEASLQMAPAGGGRGQREDGREGWGPKPAPRGRRKERREREREGVIGREQSAKEGGREQGRKHCACEAD